MNARSLTVSALAAVLVLFFLQLMADFVGSIYALSLLAFSMSSSDIANLYKASPQEAVRQVMMEIVRNVATGLILLLPVVLLFFRRRFPAAAMLMLAEVVIACRLVEPFLPSKARMLVSGLGVGCFLVLFPLWIRQQTGADPQRGSLSIGVGAALALLLSILLRTLGRGVDLSVHGWFQAVGWILGAAEAAVFPSFLIPDVSGSRAEPETAPQQEGSPAGTGRATGISLGIVGILSLIYIVFGNPGVLARWTEGSYEAVTIVAAAAAAAFIIVCFARPQIILGMPPWAIWLCNAAFVLALFATARVHQVPFPADPASYPLAAPRVEAVGQIPVFVMLLLSPIIFVDLTLLLRELGRRPPSIRALGAGFTFASLVFLLFVFAVIFTVIWAYVPGLGPVFRDRIHLVLVVGALAATAPVLMARRGAHRVATPLCEGRACWFGSLAVAVLLAGTALGATLGDMLPRAGAAQAPVSLKVLTYNLQAGVNAAGRWNFDGQLGVLRQEQPDIVGLQESDTARITGANNDEVRYLADRLGYYSCYGPKTITGTFGIALLSRYPIESPRTFYLWSEGEQTAVIEARIKVGPESLRVLVTHLGNYGPIAQERDVLTLVPGDGPVLLMGDFNFAAGGAQYAATTAVLEDCERAVAGGATRALDPDEIDHIFATPGTTVLDYRHVGGDNSDHPAALAVVRP